MPREPWKQNLKHEDEFKGTWLDLRDSSLLIRDHIVPIWSGVGDWKDGENWEPRGATSCDCAPDVEVDCYTSFEF